METGKRRTLLDVMNEVDRRDEPVPRSDFEDLEARVATLEAQHDTAQAVIEAARAVLRHVNHEVYEGLEGDTRLFVYLQNTNGTWGDTFAESDRPFPKTLFGGLAELMAALEAHDEATDESDNLSASDTD